MRAGGNDLPYAACSVQESPYLMYLNENAIPQVESMCVVRPVTDRLIESKWGETLRSTFIAFIKMEVNTAGVTKRVWDLCARTCLPAVATAMTLYDRLVFLYHAHMAALSALVLMNADINAGGIRMLMRTGEGIASFARGPSDPLLMCESGWS